MNFEITNGMSAEELRTLQLIQLELLLETDRICRKNNIKYSLCGGSLLGAVRHKGFIPWDDDADILMPRSWYTELVSAFKRDLDTERFTFSDISNTDGYRFGYGKLYRNETAFVRVGRESLPYYQGVFLDIFPIDYFPDKIVPQFFQHIRFFLIQKMTYAPIGVKVEQNAFYRALYKILSRVDLKRIRKMYMKAVEKAESRPSGLMRQCVGLNLVHGLQPINSPGIKPSWFESINEYEFEGFSLMGIQAADEFCTWNYGDSYMTPVPRPQLDLSAYKLLPREQIERELAAYQPNLK